MKFEKEFFTITEAAAYLSRPLESRLTKPDVIRLTKQGRLPICFEFDGDVTGVQSTIHDKELKHSKLPMSFTGILKSLTFPNIRGELEVALVEIVRSNSQRWSHHKGQLTKGFKLPTEEQLSNGYRVTGFIDFKKVLPSEWLFAVEDLHAILESSNDRIPEVELDCTPAKSNEATLPSKRTPQVQADSRVTKRKRQALIKELKPLWPKIEVHLNNAQRNKLSEVASLKRREQLHGDWDMAAAIQWAIEGGYLIKNKAESHVCSDPENELSILLKRLMK